MCNIIKKSCSDSIITVVEEGTRKYMNMFDDKTPNIGRVVGIVPEGRPIKVLQVVHSHSNYWIVEFRYVG